MCTKARPATTDAGDDDTFVLYDLRTEVVGCEPGKKMICNHPVGACFEVSGEDLSLPPGQTFPIYPLAALLPLIPAKQRSAHENDWMAADMDVACPDPRCGGIFRIKRIGKRVFRHGDVTAVPIERQEE